MDPARPEALSLTQSESYEYTDIPGVTTPEEQRELEKLKEQGWASSPSLEQALQDIPQSTPIFIDVGGDGMRAEKILKDTKARFCITVTFKPSHTFTNIKYEQPPPCPQPSKHLFVFADAFSEFAQLGESVLKDARIEISMLHYEVRGMTRPPTEDPQIKESLLIKSICRALSAGSQLEVLETKERVAALKDSLATDLTQQEITTTQLSESSEKIIDSERRTSYDGLAVDTTTLMVSILRFQKK